MLNKNLIINLEDLNDKSIFINWQDSERLNYSNRLFKLMKLTEFAKQIDYDLPTLSEVKNGTVKPSGYVFYNILKILNEKADIKNLLISSRNYNSIKIINNYINPELIGLIHSDGTLKYNRKKNGVMFSFCNQEKEVINRFNYLINQTFECKITIIIDKRDGTYNSFPQSIIGRILANKIGFKEKIFKIPDFTKEEIPHYIRGLFDGDGTIHLYKNKVVIPTIKITTQYKEHAEKIKLLLEKINIYSRICKEKRKNSEWFNVVITRKKDFLEFIKKIGSNHPKKKERMDDIKKEMLSK